MACPELATIPSIVAEGRQTNNHKIGTLLPIRLLVLRQHVKIFAFHVHLLRNTQVAHTTCQIAPGLLIAC